MKTVCKYCEKEFKNSGAAAKHEKHCKLNPNKFTFTEYNCCFCSKVCLGSEALTNHQNHCKQNPNRKARNNHKFETVLNCKYCNKEFVNPGFLAAHEKICDSNPQRVYYDYAERYANMTEHAKNNMAWSRGLTKETDERVAKGSLTLKLHYKDHDGGFKGKTHSEVTKAQIGRTVSNKLKEGYANGSITPAAGIGRGKYSYIITSTDKYMLRSTYEFIFALYLLIIKGVRFSLENIRVPAVTPNRYANTFISDFNIDNYIIEIKGIASGKDKYIKEAFEAAGYNFVELFESDVLKYKGELVSAGVDIDILIDKIRLGHDSKDYFIYDLSDSV